MEIKKIKSLDELEPGDLVINYDAQIVMFAGMQEEPIFVNYVEEYKFMELKEVYFGKYAGNSTILPEGTIRTSILPEEKIMKGTQEYQKYLQIWGESFK